MKTFVFDIETAPLPDDELARLQDPFNPADVKLGNVKNPELISAKLKTAAENHFSDFKERAALDAISGKVLAIGFMEMDGNEISIIHGHDEEKILTEFEAMIYGTPGNQNRWIGFNSNQFDWPFIVKRGWKYGLKIQRFFMRGRYASDYMIDLRDKWQLGDRRASGSLDAVSKHLGLAGKTGSGKDFADLYDTDQEKALAYLQNDVQLTRDVAEKIWAI